MVKPELLSPAGNFDSLKAAVQNGADAVYFGTEDFSARAYASNISMDKLKEAIDYAKIRGVKTHLTLNTLIKDSELERSFEIAKRAYEYGIDAIIVQDIGLGKLLIDSFPDLDIHASTQMSVHNLEGVLALEKLGFKRVVLARELSVPDITYICKHCNVEIECFIHGALCISYSGQCLFSSMIGGRSGNRGCCAQPCRLPYTLLENDKSIDNGYLLSTRDLCGLDYLPELVKAGVTSFKIEGRMKSPIYVSTVTRIYKKYMKLIASEKDYVIDDIDRKQLLQVFNRGQGSSGHLNKEPNNELICKEKPNNMGLFLGIVEKYTNDRYITLKLEEPIVVGDSIALENEHGIYTISELMDKNRNNIPKGVPTKTVMIGRMRGNINLGDKVFKISSKSLNNISDTSLKNEGKKIKLNCTVKIKKYENISINITSASDSPVYDGLNVSCEVELKPQDAKKHPLEKKRVIEQISKTNNTPYKFKNIEVDLDSDLFLPRISALNELRRNALTEVQNYALSRIGRVAGIAHAPSARVASVVPTPSALAASSSKSTTSHGSQKVALLLNTLNVAYDYSKLNDVDKLYIPFKYFSSKKYASILELLTQKFNTYIYLPTIIKPNYTNIIFGGVEKAIKKYDIKGFVISNISNIDLLKKVCDIKKYDLVANYTFNIFNHLSVEQIKNLGIGTYTVSPELSVDEATELSKMGNGEIIVYGKIPVLNMHYCVLGSSNNCFPDCTSKCTSNNKYYLQDRMNAKFTVIADNLQNITTVYSHKNININVPVAGNSGKMVSNVRVDILYEDIDEINNILKKL